MRTQLLLKLRKFFPKIASGLRDGLFAQERMEPVASVEHDPIVFYFCVDWGRSLIRQIDRRNFWLDCGTAHRIGHNQFANLQGIFE
jgi:hypothetical protein